MKLHELQAKLPMLRLRDKDFLKVLHLGGKTAIEGLLGLSGTTLPSEQFQSFPSLLLSTRLVGL